MKEFIQSYHIFLLKKWQKWFLYFIYPMLIFIGAFLFQNTSDPEMLLIFICIIISGFEQLFDFFTFCDINTEKSRLFNYLKTSSKGMLVFKKGLLVDTLRRFFIISFLIIIIKICYVPKLSLTQLLNFIFITLIFTSIGIIISRYCGEIYINYLLASIISLFTLMLLVLSCYIRITVWIPIFLIAVYFIITIFYTNHTLTKARNSYYEKSSN